MTHVSRPHRLHYPMQVPMGNKSQVNPDSYHTTQSLLINMTMCLLWETKLFRSHRESLTSMFQDFHLRELTVPFLLHPTHINYISLYALNRESFIGRHPKYELTTHSSTMMMDGHTHAHTPNMLMSLCICNANVTSNSHVTCLMHTT